MKTIPKRNGKMIFFLKKKVRNENGRKLVNKKIIRFFFANIIFNIKKLYIKN